ncbi:MAG: hypothetical protein LBR48_08270 [Dysgonamonadaceae bacterium]|jgi:hypothetical protein|nr:hypothetical protein [Dysgonamonadaceae bacterium]
MPYRRLPNTDSSRLKALKTAIEKSAGTRFQDLAISVATLDEAKKIVLQMERACTRYQQTLDTQINANKLFQNKVRNARMYISHFVQVLYLCVIRSEIKAGHLELYGLQDANMLVPDLSSNESLLNWGEKIIRGESQRISKGGVPIYNPSIAKVNVMFSMFKEGYQVQQLYQKSTARMQAEVAQLRSEADRIIFNIWEEVEKHTMNLPVETRLDENRKYGLIYYYRKEETVE